MDVSALATKGMVEVPYPTALRASVEEAVASWQAFCTLPEEKKRQFSKGDRANDFGYMLRNDAGTRSDSKEMFHVVEEQLPVLWSCADGVHEKRGFRFIDAVSNLIRESVPLVGEFAHAVEKEFNLSGFESEVRASHKRWTFRYLHYFGEAMLAYPHVDRGDFTLHLYENQEGGEYYGFDRHWHPWTLSGEKTVIFPSMGLQYRSGGALKALCHCVRPTPHSAQNGRFALVAFIDFNQNVRYNDREKRLQDFDPGFNYGMPFCEFQKLFVPK